MSAGYITRISGPVIYAQGMDDAGLYDVVKVGKAGLIGEIIKLKGDLASALFGQTDSSATNTAGSPTGAGTSALKGARS